MSWLFTLHYLGRERMGQSERFEYLSTKNQR